jgi:hypothetical protein
MSRRFPSVAAARHAMLLAAVLGLAGCFKQKILVLVNPDGTGHLVVSRAFSAETVAMAESSLREMRRHPADMGPLGASATNDPFFSEAKLKLEGRLYGPGVELVKARRLDRNGARGSVAVYHFKDVNQMRIPMAREENMSMFASPEMPGMDEEMQDAMASQLDAADAVLFALSKGAPKILKIQMPAELLESVQDTAADQTQAAPAPAAEEAPDEAAEEAGELSEELNAPFGITGRESGAEAARKTMRGLRLSLAVEVNGTVVKSTAAHAVKDRPQRVLLYDADFDAAMASPRFDAVMKAGGLDNPSALQEGLGRLIGLPGIALETNKEVVVEFK